MFDVGACTICSAGVVLSTRWNLLKEITCIASNCILISPNIIFCSAMRVGKSMVVVGLTVNSFSKSFTIFDFFQAVGKSCVCNRLTWAMWSYISVSQSESNTCSVVTSFAGGILDTSCCEANCCSYHAFFSRCMSHYCRSFFCCCVASWLRMNLSRAWHSSGHVAKSA